VAQQDEAVKTGSRGGYGWALGLALAGGLYAAAALGVDTLAAMGVRTPIHWAMLQWRMGGGAPVATGGVPGFYPVPGLDLLKFSAWFVIPFLLCLPWMDWRFLGFRTWRKADAILMAIAFLVGLAAVSLIAYVPGLRAYYPSLAGAETAEKARFATHMLGYTLSWLIGWEFLHRYFLLRLMDRPFPRWGWLIIPVFEGVYHLVKHPLEALGMVAASVLLTLWTRRSQNVSLPFIAHLLIEVQLILFMIWV